GETCALIDASGAFDPNSGKKAGIDLQRLLWIDCSQKVSGKDTGVSALETRNSKLKTAFETRHSTLETVLKITDLLLQAGGFGMVAIDLADLAPSIVRRVPLTSWFRFRRTVEKTSTILLVAEQEPYARSCASLALRLHAEPHWKGPAQPAHAHR